MLLALCARAKGTKQGGEGMGEGVLTRGPTCISSTPERLFSGGAFYSVPGVGKEGAD